MEFLNTTNFFTEAQYGFLSKKSTETATFDVITETQNILDRKKIGAELLIGMKKAFDTSHRIILLKKTGYL